MRDSANGWLRGGGLVALLIAAATVAGCGATSTGASGATQPSPTADPTSAAPSPSAEATVIDGPAMIWPGPRGGGMWRAGAAARELTGPRLAVWQQAVRRAVPALAGTSTAAGYVLGDDGGVSYARFAGPSGGAAWAQGPDVGALTLDPCSGWPASPSPTAVEPGQTCRIIGVDGRPVVVRESPAELSVFSVRADGVAVRLDVSSAGTGLTDEDVAKAALALPAP